MTPFHLKKAFVGLVLIVGVFLSDHSFAVDKNAPAKTDAANSTAVEVVENLHQLLIKSMKLGSNATCTKRYELLAPFIEKNFDFPFISRIVLGRKHWKQMDEETKKRFITAFANMTIATYARRFDSYSGQRFETVSSHRDRRGFMIVKAVLIKPDGDKIDFTYVCRKTGDNKWKIVSVSAKGVNDLSVKRADYNSFLKNHSIDELINKLLEQAQKCLGDNKTS